MDADDFLLLARSDLWSDRVRAGQALSAYAGELAADTALQRLLLDSDDTAVIARTADALLARADVNGWRVFAAAWIIATPSQADHLSGSLSRALFEASLDSEKAEQIKHAIVALSTDKDETTRAGARQLLTRVTIALPG